MIVPHNTGARRRRASIWCAIASYRPLAPVRMQDGYSYCQTIICEETYNETVSL